VRDARLTPVTQSNHPPADHARHDRLLVVRHAAGDPLDPAELTTVRHLRATCPECAALADEIPLISRATATAAAPTRPRDFRLTARDAERLRGSVVRRFFDRLAAPRGAILRPAAGAILGIGLVLVVAGTAIPRMNSAPAREAFPGGGVVLKSSGPDLSATSGAEYAAPQASAAGMSVMSSQVAGTPEPNPQVQRQDSGPQVMIMAGTPEPTQNTTAVQVASPEARDDHTGEGRDAVEANRADDPIEAILVLGILLSVTGLLVLARSFVAGRLSRGST
jgi:hypothetical protein